MAKAVAPSVSAVMSSSDEVYGEVFFGTGLPLLGPLPLSSLVPSGGEVGGRVTDAVSSFQVSGVHRRGQVHQWSQMPCVLGGLLHRGEGNPSVLTSWVGMRGGRPYMQEEWGVWVCAGERYRWSYLGTFTKQQMMTGINILMAD